MKAVPYTRISVILLVTALAACSSREMKPQETNLEYQHVKTLINAGKVEEGMERLQSLINSFPKNPEYRAYLKQQQDMQLAILLKEADQFRQHKRWGEADIAYRRVLDMDEQNQRAQNGIQQMRIASTHEAIMKRAQDLLSNNDAEGAQNLARAVLAEDASNTSARALFEQIEQKRMDKLTNPPQIRSAFKRPISLEFKDVAIKSIFEFISQAAGINFTYDQELRGDQRTSVFLRNTPIEEAIEVILTSNQLAKKVLNDNTLLIYPQSRSQEYQETFVRSFYLSNTDAKKLMSMIKTVVKTKDIYVDEKLNTLVMRDTAEAIRTAEKLIISQDMAEPEVMLQVEVLEINRRSLENIGIRYPTSVGLGVQGRDTVNGTTTLSPGKLTVNELKNFNSNLGVFSISDPVLALNLLQQDTDTNLLANPHIRVKNREKAKIHVGDRIPVLTSVANSTGFVSQTVNYIEVGIKLDVEPTIMLKDEVSIKVGLEVSNQTDRLTSSTGTVTYTIGTRNANTILRLKNGETQILAGLLRDDEQKISNGVPGLSKLPFIGRLFSDRNNDHSKKEIALLITPHIINNLTPADAVYTTFPAGIDRSGGANRGGRPNVEINNNVAVQSAAPVKTPQEIQAERAESDRSFAGSVMRPMDEISSPDNGTPR
ncbi:secretin and TonB N-terminal domain-containing protein [Methylobacillus gramineus]|uniref:secretin and TonB N-terminal domain-containing protein n=1 Tax=Methylobacillus gramineus TaxID=755169 RepID=UPI001D000C6A|nr:secretin and TonB N-terminal domain-containing protein [Methylobacillus gramineus]MCB5183829.1 secretin and TonB N-terminal domain-containing protein [Methylobacillus gramineus]